MLKKSMNKKSITIISLIAFVLGGIVVSLGYEKMIGEGSYFSFPATPVTPVGAPKDETPPQPSYYQPKYTSDGKIDTSDWVTYTGEISGYSVLAPKGYAWIGVNMRQPYQADTFVFDLMSKKALSSIPLVKEENSNLLNWVEKHVSSYPEKITDRKITTIGKYKVLEFDAQGENNHITWPSIKGAYYPGFYQKENKIQEPYNIYGHYFVVDAGDRYVIFSYDNTPDKKSLDVYNTIISSLDVFAPKTAQ